MTNSEKKIKSMKTAEEFYKEIAASKELQEEVNALEAGRLDVFLKKHDCAASAKEFMAFANSITEGELDDDGAEEISGGIFHMPMFTPDGTPVL